MIKLVLLRHGESTWNRDKRFSGWTDVPLTKKGKEEARHAGELMKEAGFIFDECHTSVLIRAIDTLKITLQEMGMENLPIQKSWRLNERHYGALQGESKPAMAEKVGAEKVHRWRRSYDARPPALEKDDDRHPGKDPLYSGVDPKDLPATESLKDCIARTMPYWHKVIEPALRKGKKLLVCAHGNSIRGIVEYLDKLSPEEITKVEIPTGMPLVYGLDGNLKPVKKYYLGDQEKVKRRVQRAADQAVR